MLNWLNKFSKRESQSEKDGVIQLKIFLQFGVVFQSPSGLLPYNPKLLPADPGRGDIFILQKRGHFHFGLTGNPIKKLHFISNYYLI
jgi:hypothetical protein